MAYAGYLLKIGTYQIPHSLIKAESYKPYLNMQDLDSYTDADGYLHRFPVTLKVAKVELETKAMLTNTEFATLMTNISSQYTNPTGRECMITAYIPETDSYVEQKGYLADFEPEIYHADATTVTYNPIRLAFIGGVK